MRHRRKCPPSFRGIERASVDGVNFVVCFSRRREKKRSVKAYGREKEKEREGFEWNRPHEYPPGCKSDGHFPRREQASMFEAPDEMLQSFFEGFALGQAFVKTFQSLKIAQPSGHFQVRERLAREKKKGG